MKKYEKPVVVIENFMFSQSIARDCSESIPSDQVNLSDIGCGWNLGGDILFVLDNGCTMDGENSGIACYNNPGEGSYIFRS